MVLAIVSGQLNIALLRRLMEAHSYRALFGFPKINLKIFILEYLMLATFIKLDLFPRPQVQDRLGIVESIIFRHFPLKIFLLKDIILAKVLVLEVLGQGPPLLLLLFRKFIDTGVRVRHRRFEPKLDSGVIIR